MGSGAFQNPPRRPGPAFRPAPPNAEEYTEQFPAIVRDEAEAPESVDEPPAPDEPPAGLANWRKRRRKVATDDTEIGVMPAYSDEPVEPEPDAGMLDPGPPTRGFAPPPPFALAWANPPRGDEHPVFDDDLHDGHNGHHGYPELNGAQLDDEYDYDDDLDEYEAELDEDLDDLDDLHEPDDEFDEPEEQVSPAKQWLTLAGQLALGVVGGAAVWLGFNWLWVNLPAAALIAALLVVVGLVWIVRKIRRAEDLQTTVLAVLVGLVVTVSPAALLLVSR
jgi:hypothetical protein